MKSFILSFLIFALSQHLVFSTSRSTSEAVALSNVRSAMEAFKHLHGFFPTNWSQVGEMTDLDVINRQSLAKSPAYPIQAHYVFVKEDKISVPDSQMGDLVLIRTSAVKYGEGEEEREGRYLISRYEGLLKSTWLSENKIQQMLVDAGIKELPKPEPWSPPTNNAVSPESNPFEGARPSPGVHSPSNPSAATTTQRMPDNSATQVAEIIAPKKSRFALIATVLLGCILLFLLFRKTQKPK